MGCEPCKRQSLIIFDVETAATGSLITHKDSSICMAAIRVVKIFHVIGRRGTPVSNNLPGDQYWFVFHIGIAV